MLFLSLVLYLVQHIRGIPVDIELAITTGFLENLSVSRCVCLLDADDPSASKRIRVLSDKRMHAAVMDAPRLKQILQFHASHYGSTEIVTFVSNSSAAIQLMANISQNELSKKYWIMFLEVDSDFSILNWLNVPFNTLFFLIVPSTLLNSSFHAYFAYDYYILQSRTARMREIAKWSSDGGFQVYENIFKNRKDLSGISLSLLRPENGLLLNDAERTHLELWYTMGQMMNFSTKIAAPGYPWDAYSGVTVFHANGLLSDPTLLDSIAPIWRYTVYIYVKEQNESFSASSFSQPFTTSAWTALTFCLLLTTLSIVMVSYCRVYDDDSSMVQAAFLASDSISNQCGHEVGPHVSKRIIVLFIRWLALLTVPAYTASITSILTLQYPDYPFTDLVGLVQDGTYKLTAANDTFMVGYYEYSNNPLARIISTEFFDDQATMPVTTDEGILKACNGQFALLTLESHVTGRDLPCKLLRIPNPAFSTFAGMHLYPGSPFRRLFFTNLVRFHTAGILQKVGHKMPTREIKNPAVIVVHFSHVQPLLFMVYSGWIFSTIILAIEIYCCKYFTNRTKRKKAEKVVPLPRELIMFLK